jgi:hypothetical protein
VGQPPQVVYLMPSMFPINVIVSGPDGCADPALNNKTYPNAVQDPPLERWEMIQHCPQSRGALYDYRNDTAVTVFDPETFYPGIDDQTYGDSSRLISTNLTNSRGIVVPFQMLTTKISFGSQSSENEPVVKVPIGTISSTDFGWLGHLGISPESDISATRAQLSGLKTNLLSSLKSSGYIPRLSWAYTAGAYASKL